MSEIGNVLSEDDDIPLWIDIPQGYFALPLDSAGAALDQAGSLLTDATERGQAGLVDVDDNS
ncbi:hypothetical protein [Amycolatopsis pigmentata]|uniref:Uncharacterized protein n=1 Tax=Amycolatopsis pigmentata TaxID=450801 RepID=A0ABW5G165_9PSEU